MNLDKIAQEIVNATMTVINNRNINIMNTDGIIIASGEKSRVNTFHKGAFDVIKTGKTIDIYPEHVHEYEGAKEGVNMPLVINNRVIGVVGVHGNPDEVRIITKLVKTYVELAVDQSLISEDLKAVKDLKSQLIRKLIYDNASNIEEDIYCISRLLGVELDMRRYAVVIKIDDSTYKDTLAVFKDMGKIESHLIDSGFLTDKDFGSVINEKFIMFKYNSKNTNPLGFMEELKHSINHKLGIVIKISSGSCHDGIAGYKKSYKEALEMLRLGKGKILDINTSQTKAIFLLNQIDEEVIEHFIEEVYSKILDENGRTQSWVISTLEALFDNNLSVGEAAKQLFVHKNTMTYRMKKIESLTGLSIGSNFYDSVLLYLLIIYAEKL